MNAHDEYLADALLRKRWVVRDMGAYDAVEGGWVSLWAPIWAGGLSPRGSLLSCDDDRWSAPLGYQPRGGLL